MGLFGYATNGIIQDLNILNITYQVGITIRQIWNEELDQTHFLGQVLGYGKNMVFQNIKINIDIQTSSNGTDVYQGLNNTNSPFIQNISFFAGDEPSEVPFEVRWCFIKPNQFIKTDGSTYIPNFKFFNGVIGGYQEGSLSKSYIYSSVTSDYTFYDSSINGDYCRYKTSQLKQDASLMFGAYIR